MSYKSERWTMESNNSDRESHFILFRQGIFNSVDLFSLTSKFLPLGKKSKKKHPKANKNKSSDTTFFLNIVFK